MTVSSTTNKVTYAGDDSTTTFAFSWDVQEPATGVDHDLTVIKVTDATGAEETLTEGAGSNNYSVTVATYPGAGSITYPATGSANVLATGESLIIVRTLTQTQDTDLDNRGGYFPETQEQTFDRLVMMVQHLQEQVDRCLKITRADKDVDSASADLPDMQAEEYVRVKSDGSGFEMSGFVTSTASAGAATPQDVTSGAGSAGAATAYSREDHVHSIGSAADVVADTTPQLGGDLDANTFDILFDTTTGIHDENDNEQLLFVTTGSAVNHIQITNAATGNGPDISAVGDDTDINLELNAKGTGEIILNGTLTLQGNLDVGSSSIVSASAGDIAITPDTTGSIILDGQKWPQADGIAGQTLSTDGAGQLQWQDNIGQKFDQATTDATPTVVASIAMPTDSAKMIHVSGVAVRTDTYAEAMGFRVMNVCLNDGGTTTVGADVQHLIDSSPVSWNVTVVANDTTDVAEITVTGAAGTNINWHVHVWFEDVT